MSKYEIIIYDFRRGRKLLRGKTVKEIKRYNENEVIIKFEGKIEFLIFGFKDGLDLSITGDFEEDE